jgi:hypothetical protein
MKKLLATAAIAVALTTSACTTTNVQTTTNEFTASKAESTTLMFTPDVEMSALLASGILEPRADWSENAKNNLQAALQSELEQRDSKVAYMGDEATLTEKQVQLLKLKDAVLQANQSFVLLKNKKDTFDLTLGPDAKALSGDENADYALLTSARGSFQTAGKMAVNAALIVLGAATGGGAYIQTGQQVATVSLVDLSTGDIVWTNTASLAAADPRDAEGAKKVANTLLKEFPL